MDIFVTIIAFLLVFLPVVVLHEWGHYIAARLCNIPTFVFSVGMGRVLWQRRDSRGMRWQIALLPLGGYVSFDPPPHDKDKKAPSTFETAHPMKKIIISLSGPLMNFMFGFLLLCVLIYQSGVPDTQQVAPIVVQNVLPQSVAARIDIRPHDVIVQLDDYEPLSVDDFTTALQKKWPSTLTIQRQKELITLSIPEKSATNVLGVHLETTIRNLNLAETATKSANVIYNVTTYTGRYLWDIMHGKASAEQLSGPIGIAHSSKIAFEEGWYALFLAMALLSIALGITNLLPLPMLDGGHIVLACGQLLLRKTLPSWLFSGWQQFGIVLMLFIFGFTCVIDIANWITNS